MIDEITTWQKLVKPEKDLHLSWQLVEEEYEELCDALENAILEDDEDNRNEAAKEAADLVVVATRVLYDLGFDPKKVLEEVNRSNWSKLFKPDRLSFDSSTVETIQDYNERKNTEIKSISKGWCGCFKENGKLAKGPFYKSVDFKNFK